MLGAFNTVYTALQSFFSRGFWFSTFLPVALFSAIHCLIALVTYGSFSLFGMNLSLKSAPSGEFTEAAALIVVAFVVASFTLAPFVEYLRGVLDGSLLPKALHDCFRKHRYKIAQAKQQELDALFDDLGTVNDVNERYSADNGPIKTAYEAAKNRVPKTATNENVVTAAHSALLELDKGLADSKPLAPLVAAAENAVVAALQQNAPDLNDPTRPDETACSNATELVASELEGKLRSAVLLAKYRYQIVKDRYRLVDAIEFPWATALGDARFIAESYPRSAYNVEFDYLWPRLLMALKAAKSDDSRLAAIENARATIEFAVLSFFLVLTIPLVWIPVLWIRGGSGWLFLAVGAASPLLLQFFFRLAFESQLAFANVVSTAIDIARFVVFDALRLPEPSSRSEECALWGRIAGKGELLYTPQEASRGAASDK